MNRIGACIVKRLPQASPKEVRRMARFMGCGFADFAPLYDVRTWIAGQVCK